MGILTRLQGKTYVITSDHTAEEASSKRAPRHLNEAYHVWTGTRWSDSTVEALTFASLDDADEYVRANYLKVRV